MVQSVMDTLSNRAVYVFFIIVFYVVLSFSLTYHIAFGPDVETYKTFGTSL